jgi:flagellar protein FliO/FliZ
MSFAHSLLDTSLIYGNGANLKTKTSVILATIVVLACGGFAFAEKGVDANELGLFSSSSSDSLFGKKPADLADENLGGSLYKMIFSLALVVGLAYGVMYLSKKVLPKVSGVAGRRVQVLETVSLGSRRTVHLLSVGGRHILIGSTQNNITHLADVPADEADVETESAEGAK